jgi:pimeloyl-ACP methyl ester carboxylesterase
MAAFLEWGDPRGVPLVWIPGSPSSRLARPNCERVRGMRVERPGYGITPMRDATILDVARDIRDVLDHLKIDRCYVAAISGGGPYALACGVLMPERVTRIAVSGIFPPQHLAKLPLAQRAIFGLASRGLLPLRHPNAKRFYDQMLRTLAPVDRKVIEPMYQRQLENVAEAFRVSAAGFVQDLKLHARPWGFDLAEVKVPVDLWYGSEDQRTPPRFAEVLAKHLPRSRTFIVPNEGHLLMYADFDRIVAKLTA